MSDIARFWSRNLHGLNFAEHAICRELAEWHNEETNLCYPNLNTLINVFECSRPYLKKILLRLDLWQLVNRIEWFDPAERNRQTSNRYRLNLNRHFPDPPEARSVNNKNKKQNVRTFDNRDWAAITGAKQGRRILQVIHYNLPTRHAGLKEGLTEAYLDKARNTCWVCVSAQGYMDEFLGLLPQLSMTAQHETSLKFGLMPVALYFKAKKR